MRGKCLWEVVIDGKTVFVEPSYQYYLTFRILTTLVWCIRGKNIWFICWQSLGTIESSCLFVLDKLWRI